MRIAIMLLAACGGSDDKVVDAGSDAKVVDAKPAPDAKPAALGVLFVNEVMASNKAACADPFGEFDDWAELYNSGSTDLDLTGYSVTDDLTMPTKFVFNTGVTVPAHGYKLIWCDDQVQGPDHATFKLSADGEAFAIFAPDGTLLDKIEFGMATTDVSFARVPDGTGDFVSCTTSSCGATNKCTTP